MVSRSQSVEEEPTTSQKESCRVVTGQSHQTLGRNTHSFESNPSGLGSVLLLRYSDDGLSSGGQPRLRKRTPFLEEASQGADAGHPSVFWRKDIREAGDSSASRYPI